MKNGAPSGSWGRWFGAAGRVNSPCQISCSGSTPRRRNGARPRTGWLVVLDEAHLDRAGSVYRCAGSPASARISLSANTGRRRSVVGAAGANSSSSTARSAESAIESGRDVPNDQRPRPFRRGLGEAVGAGDRYGRSRR